MQPHDANPDRYEPIVVWLDQREARDPEPAAAAWLTYDRQDGTLTFHSPTHHEEVASIGGARIAAVLWSIRTGVPLEGPLFVHPDDPRTSRWTRDAVDRAIVREAARYRTRAADRLRDVDRER